MNHYRDDVYFSSEKVGYSDYQLQETSLRLTFREFIKVLSERRLTGGKLLEIGAGFGYFLDEARGSFAFRAGTEMSRAAAQHAASFADLMIQGGLDDLQADSRFDCIFLSQVIEHVYHPQALVEQIKAHLEPDGKVIIITPNMGSLWRTLMGARWPSFKVPEHVLFFDSSSLSRLLQSCGFREILTLPYPHAFPLKVVAAKFNMALPNSLDRLNIWLPGTCLAICASAHG